MILHPRSMMGAEVAVFYLLMEQGLIALEKMEEGACEEADRNFYTGKVETVRYYCRNFLSQVFGRARIIRMEDTTVVEITEACL